MSEYIDADVAGLRALLEEVRSRPRERSIYVSTTDAMFHEFAKEAAEKIEFGTAVRLLVTRAAKLSVTEEVVKAREEKRVRLIYNSKAYGIAYAERAIAVSVLRDVLEAMMGVTSGSSSGYALTRALLDKAREQPT